MRNSKSCLMSAAGMAAMLVSTLAAAQNQPAAPHAVRVHAKLDGFDAGGNKAAASGPKNQIGGASRGLGGVALLAPSDGKAYTLTPVFFWSGTDGMGTKFKLADSAGAVVYTQNVDSAAWLQYPASAPALTPGIKYTWTVSPEPDMMSGPPRPAEITIVGDPERGKVAAELPAGSDMQSALARARDFVEARCWYDAIAAYTDLIAAHPDMKVLYEERGTVYEQIPATKMLAQHDFDKARTL